MSDSTPATAAPRGFAGVAATGAKDRADLLRIAADMMRRTHDPEIPEWIANHIGSWALRIKAVVDGG